jgi:hypothetical protein
MKPIDVKFPLGTLGLRPIQIHIEKIPRRIQSIVFQLKGAIYYSPHLPYMRS